MLHEKVAVFTEVHFELDREGDEIPTGTDHWTVTKCKEDPNSENWTYSINKTTNLFSFREVSN